MTKVRVRPAYRRNKVLETRTLGALRPLLRRYALLFLLISFSTVSFIYFSALYQSYNRRELLLYFPLHYASVYEFPSYMESLGNHVMSVKGETVDVLIVLYYFGSAEASQLVVIEQCISKIKQFKSVDQVCRQRDLTLK
jgi:hypothetical protein